MIVKSIPKSWQIKSLEEILLFVIGGDWGKDETYSDETYDLAYCIRGSEIKNWEIDRGKTASLRKIKKTNIEKRKLQNGDILVEISGGGPEQPVGRTVLIDNISLNHNKGIPKICTNFLRLIRPKEEIDSKYLNLYLKLFYYSGEIVKYQAGSNNLRNLKFPDYLKIEIPLPPLETQQTIVSKIEELFSELDKGIEDLKTAQQQLKTYRQSVLKWAFEGKLTNENVKDGELPNGWKMAAINTVSSINPKLPNKENLDREMEVQFLPMKLVEEIVNKIHLSDIKKLHEVLKGSYTPFIDNDIIFAKVTPCMENGKIAIVEKLKNGIGFGSSEFHVIRTNEKVNNKFMFYFLVQDRFRNEAANEMTGAVGLRRVPKQFIENHQIPIPSTEEQHLIVQEIDSRLSVADKMEESIAQSLQQAEALRQSILKKAFSGELV